MPLHIHRPKDVLAGLIFVAFGATTFVLSHEYEMGTAIAMGPGYFPAAIAVVLVLVGLLAVVRGVTVRVPDPVTKHRLEPLVLVFAAILAFSLLIERAGLFVAAAVLIGIACFRRLLSNPLEVLLLYLGLTGFAALVFVRWFDLRLPLVWWQ